VKQGFVACGEGDTLTFHGKSPVYFTWKKENYISRTYYVEAAEAPVALQQHIFL
jgi:hypothetical protein